MGWEPVDKSKIFTLSEVPEGKKFQFLFNGDKPSGPIYKRKGNAYSAGKKHYTIEESQKKSIVGLI